MANAAITVDLNAKIAQFETELKRATGTLDNFGKKGNQIAAGFKSAFGGLAAGLSVGAFVAFTNRVLDAGDELDKLAKRTNIAVKDLASLQLIAQQSDTNLDSLAKGINRLSVSLAEAAGDNKELAQAFKDLGVTAKDPIEAMYQLADATKNTTDSNKTNADLMKVLSKSYQEMLPFLREGGAGLRDAAERSKDYAEAMAKLSPVAAAFNDNVAALRQELNTTVAEGMTPFIAALNDLSAAYLNANNESVGFATWGERFGNVMKGYVIIAEGFILTFKTVINTVVYGSSAIQAALSGNLSKSIYWIEQLGKKSREAAAEYAAFSKAVALGTNVPAFTPTGVNGGDQTAQLECVLSGGRWDGKKCVPKKTGGSKSDPLASIISSTDIARTQEYNKLLDLLNKRYDNGKKNAELYGQALKKLNDQFGKSQIDVFDSGSFKTTSKEVAEFIKAQQDAINGLNGEMGAEAQQNAEAYKAKIDSLFSGTTAAKAKELHDNIAAIDKAFFDGEKTVEEWGEAIKSQTSGAAETLKETRSLAEELGLTFTSAFEDAVAGGKSLSDVLKALEQDIIKIITRKMVTEPLGEFVKGIDFGSIFPFAAGGIMTSAGSLPLTKYASGGIANSPQLAMFGEGSRPEAYVPLPDGRRIPVAMSGGGSTVINMNINTPDANSFRASQGQITAQMGRALARGRRYS